MCFKVPLLNVREVVCAIPDYDEIINTYKPLSLLKQLMARR